MKRYALTQRFRVRPWRTTKTYSEKQINTIARRTGCTAVVHHRKFLIKKNGVTLVELAEVKPAEDKKTLAGRKPAPPSVWAALVR